MHCKYRASTKEIGPDMRIPMFQEVNMATKFLDKEIIHPMSIETGYEPVWKDKKCRIDIVFIYNLTEGAYYKNVNRIKDGHEFYQAGEECLVPVMRGQILSDPDQHRRDFDRLVAEVTDLRKTTDQIETIKKIICANNLLTPEVIQLLEETTISTNDFEEFQKQMSE